MHYINTKIKTDKVNLHFRSLVSRTSSKLLQKTRVVNSITWVKTVLLYICKSTESLTIEACGIKVLRRSTLEPTIKTLKITFMIVLLYFYFFIFLNKISYYEALLLRIHRSVQSSGFPLCIDKPTFELCWAVSCFFSLYWVNGHLSSLGILISVLVEELGNASLKVKRYCS